MTSFAKTTISAQVTALLQADEDELPIQDRERMIPAALERYSHDKPDEVTTDLSGDGGKYYAITGLTSFDEGFSRVVRIEYPAQAVSADESPQWLEPEDWDDNYWDGAARYLYFPNHTPASGETARVTYTAPYELSADAVDLPPQDFQAVCYLVASLCCQAIATRYSRTSDSTITADSVDHSGRAERFRQRAREYMQMYQEQLRLGKFADSADGPAGEFVDWDTRPSWGASAKWLFHGQHNTRSGW